MTSASATVSVLGISVLSRLLSDVYPLMVRRKGIQERPNDIEGDGGVSMQMVFYEV
jgi:hypothetical protein